VTNLDTSPGEDRQHPPSHTFQYKAYIPDFRMGSWVSKKYYPILYCTGI